MKLRSVKKNTKEGRDLNEIGKEAKTESTE